MGYLLDLDEHTEAQLVRELAARRISRDAGLCDYCNRPPSTPTCRFPDRHAGNVDPGLLFITDVSRVSRSRARRWHHDFPAGSWTGADWSNAMCGEAGETANVVKKLRRIETGADPGPLDGDRAELLDQLADEIADVYLYLDLLAAFYDVDLERAIARKFNAVSVRQGFPERLGAPTIDAAVRSHVAGLVGQQER